MPSETVSDGIFIVINKNQDKATNADSTDSTEPIHSVLQHPVENLSL
ncbi:hypothetical protein [Neisseria meningitidis]|nr:hypothetical protein [Neisseria meningitidis]